ncbi:MAG TPA: hypothetical protein DCP98_03305 [Sphaerochaeta sp.]|nr:hypothetical protein [Sphaerochaeta sp.]
MKSLSLYCRFPMIMLSDILSSIWIDKQPLRATYPHTAKTSKRLRFFFDLEEDFLSISFSLNEIKIFQSFFPSREQFHLEGFCLIIFAYGWGMDFSTEKIF